MIWLLIIIVRLNKCYRFMQIWWLAYTLTVLQLAIIIFVLTHIHRCGRLVQSSNTMQATTSDFSYLFRCLFFSKFFNNYTLNLSSIRINHQTLSDWLIFYCRLKFSVLNVWLKSALRHFLLQGLRVCHFLSAHLFELFNFHTCSHIFNIIVKLSPYLCNYRSKSALFRVMLSLALIINCFLLSIGCVFLNNFTNSLFLLCLKRLNDPTIATLNILLATLFCFNIVKFWCTNNCFIWYNVRFIDWINLGGEATIKFFSCICLLAVLSFFQILQSIFIWLELSLRCKIEWLALVLILTLLLFAQYFFLILSQWTLCHDMWSGCWNIKSGILADPLCQISN